MLTHYKAIQKEEVPADDFVLGLPASTLSLKIYTCAHVRSCSANEAKVQT